MRLNDTESSILEFKREIPQNDQIIKTAIGFCNLYGGKIIVGVDDDRNIIGIDETKIDQIIESLNNSIYDSSTPPIFPKVYSQRIEDKVVLIIEISEGAKKPYFRTSEGMENGTYIRMGNSTVKSTVEIIQELEWQGKGKYHDEIPVYQADRSDLDENLIIEFLKNRKHGYKDSITDKILKSYKLLIYEQSRFFPTIGALLLFGKNPQYYLSESFIICTHFKGVEGRNAIASVDCTGTLFQQIDEALQFVFNRLYKSYTIKGLQRAEVLEIPEVAVREVLYNAIVHRNYSINGPIKIAIYEDRLEIFSPGLFPGPLNVNDLEQGITYIRNMVISKVFRETGIIEKLGSGFISLFSSYREWGLEKPTVIEGLNFVKCILPRKKLKQQNYFNYNSIDKVEECKSFYGKKTLTIIDESSDDNIILALFERFDEITMNLVLKRTGWARATAGRRLKKLLDERKIIKIGAGRYCRYRLSSMK